jgi:hypothetical protein
MADHGGGVEFGNLTGDDYAAHVNTYDSFVGMAKYGTIAVVILLVLMAFFLL